VYFGWLAATVVAYCVLAQIVKVMYMRRFARWL
jgi:Mg2+-importing ATPase